MYNPCDGYCSFDIWAPDHRTDMNNTAFSCYAMESEGDLPTRRGKIEKLINILANSDNPNDYYAQLRAYEEAGLDDISDEEASYVEREVARRW